MPGPEVQDDDKYNIHAQILKKYGQDFSPEARAAVEAKAAQQKNSFGVVGGGLLSALGNVIAGDKPDFSPLERRRAQIDEETTGEFDKKREQAVRDYVMGNAMEDRGLKNKVAETTFGDAQTDRTREKGFEAQSDDPASAESQELQNFYREVRGEDKIGNVPLEKLSATQLKPLLDQAIKMRQATRPTGSAAGWGPADAEYLAGWQAYINGQADGPPDPAGASPKAIQQGNQLGSSFQGRNRTQAGREMAQADKVAAKRKFYMDAERTMQNALDAPLNGIGDITALYSFIHNQDDTAAREGELQLAQRGASIIDKIQRIVGNVVDGRLLSDNQRQQIRAQIEIMKGGIRDQHQHYLKNVKSSADTLGWNYKALIPDYEESTAAPAEAPPSQAGQAEAQGAAPKPAAPEAKKVVHKQYSKSANKTKLIYSDGTEEIVDGQQ